MMGIRELRDIHTHCRGQKDALVSLLPDEALADDWVSQEPKTPFSLSLHPWFVTEQSISTFDRAIATFRHDPMLMAIGECGLDNRCPTPLDLQAACFEHSLETAKALRLPVILHCVGQWSELIRLCRPYQQELTLIVHGFRKGPVLARQLLDAGFSLSLGKHYQPEVLEIIPKDKLFFETDELQRT